MRSKISPGLTHAFVAALVAVCVLWGTSPAHAEDPPITWSTLETEHFVIHYHDGLEAVSVRVATLAEQAHAALASRLDWTPRGPTHLILDDRVDTANGLAGALPRNHIHLNMTAPDGRGNLGDYDDWLRLLITHEYVHILHIDTIGGIPAILNRTLGKTMMPNQLLPRWYIEGLATYFESTRTGGGRAFSSLAHMQLRTAYLDGAFFDLGQLTGLPLAWPGGSAAYLYGSHFLNYIAETRGEGVFGELHHKYGTHLAPFSVNSTLREVLGRDDFVSLWAEWKAHIAGRYQAELLTLHLEGTTPVEYLTTRGGLSDAPRHRPGHAEVSFFRSDGYVRSGIYAYDLGQGTTRLLVPIDTKAGAHGWDPTGRFVVYHTRRMFREVYSFNELVVHDTRTGEEVQITDGGRARDPAVAPNGKRVAYVQNGGATNELREYDFERRSSRPILVSSQLAEMDTPAYSPDGRYVALSYWRGRHRDIYVVDSATRRLIQLTDDRALDLDPSFSPDGQNLLFASDRTGIYDIYALDVSRLDERVAGLAPATSGLTGPLFGSSAQRVTLPEVRLTRVKRGVFSPQVVHQGGRDWLYVTAFNAEGFNLGRLPLEPVEPAPKATIVDRNPPRPVVDDPILDRHAYAPSRYLDPLSIYPLMAFTNSGRDSYGAEIVGAGPVGLHSWSLVGEFFNDTETGFMVAGYSYGGLPVGLHLSGQYVASERARSYVAESKFIKFREASYDGQISLSLPLIGANQTHIFGLAYNPRFTDYLVEPHTTPEPADTHTIRPRMGNFSSLILSWDNASLSSESHSVGTELGYSLHLALRFRDRVTGADFGSTQVDYSAKVYLPVPLLTNHALSFRATGGMGRSNFLGSLYALGGLPPQEIMSAVINQLPLGGTYLRGYEPFAFSGNQFHMLSTEYRMPLWDVDHGFDTLPVFMRRLSLAVFTDTGAAFDGPMDEADFNMGSGAELRISTLFGYTMPASFRLGYAHGFGTGGLDDVYFFFGGIF